MGITKCIVRWGLIGGLGLGGLTMLIGPERVAAGLAQIRTKAQHVVDSAVDDPIALRRQVAQLADKYPDRIAEVRGAIAEVDHQIGQFEYEVDVSTRVVAMTTDHLTELKTLVARAQSAQEAKARPVSIRFEGVRFDIDEAFNEARRINNVRSSHADNLAHYQQQLTFLGEQKNRLTEILGKLDDEYSTFQAQLLSLDRQIDAIERNERLIELTEAQQETLESYEKFGKVGNLKQLEAKLAELRTIQEAQLQTLAKRSSREDYRRQAEYEMETQDIHLDNPFAEIEVNADEFEGDDVASDYGDVFVEPMIFAAKN